MSSDRFWSLTLADLLFPARDETFGSLGRGLSERTSAPPGDNFFSNEDSYPRVAGSLARRVPTGDVYLGVGPDQNFTFIAHTRPSLAIVLDYRRRNTLVHLLHKALMCLSADRFDYLSRLTARRPVRSRSDAGLDDLLARFRTAPLDPALLQENVGEVARLLRSCDAVREEEWLELASIQARIAGPGLEARFLALRMYPTLARMIATHDREGSPAHWLAAEGTYQRVRSLQLGDRILPVVGDFAGTAALPALASWMRHRGLKVGVLYVSDVEFFLLRAGKFGAYVDNLGRLPWASEAVVVRTSTRPIEHPERVPGDSATTIVRPVAAFLDQARAGRVRTVEDLFR
ncbi:MAG: hypothetical protein U0835_09210 [Isosphaeraceae bacterium]